MPPEYFKIILKGSGLPAATAVLDDRFEGEEELVLPAATDEDLRNDPDVAAVLEAADALVGS